MSSHVNVNDRHLPCSPAIVGLQLRLQTDFSRSNKCTIQPHPSHRAPQPNRAPPHTFPQFCRLPAELRIQIWELAFAEPCLWRYVRGFNISDPGLVAVGHAPSLAGFSCVEAREIMKRLYIPVANTRGRGVCWMDPERTVLDLSLGDSRNFVQSMTTGDLALFRNVVLPNDPLSREWPNHLVPELLYTSMTGVRTVLIELTSISHLHIPTSTPACAARAAVLVDLALSDCNMVELEQTFTSNLEARTTATRGSDAPVKTMPPKRGVAQCERRDIMLKWLLYPGLISARWLPASVLQHPRSQLLALVMHQAVFRCC